MFRTVLRAVAAGVILPLFMLLLPTASILAAPSEIIRIGVLVNRSLENTVTMWTPTAEYLTAQIPGFAFSIVPLDYQQIAPAVERNDVDFVLANSSIYVELETRYSITRIATLKSRRHKGAHSSFGGVIFCRADRKDIRELGDLRGKSFAAVDETSLGGWQVAWRELKANGIDPFRNFSSLEFLHAHDAVVNAVRAGQFDAGTVRTDILENLAETGRINFADLRILNPQRQGDFSFVLSTRLYPEWPFAKVNGTPEALAKKVAVSLLNMPPESPAAQASHSAGWTTPLVYQPVHDLMKELRIGPYRDYGKITLGAAIRLYWYWVVLAALALVAMSAITGRLIRLNSRLKLYRKELEDSRRNLKLKVQERTADLEKRNEDLRREVDQRTQAEMDSHQAREERGKAREFLQAVIDGVNEEILVIAPDHRVVLMNHVARDFPPPDSCCYRVSHYREEPCAGEHPCPLQAVLETKKPAIVTHTHRHRSGAAIQVEILASPIFDSHGEVMYVVEACRDVTEKLALEALRRNMQERLFQEQKEQSIVTLAGGIAHDFNNILMGVIGNAELLKILPPAAEEHRSRIDTIIGLSNRMAHLTRQLLAYSRQGAYERIALSLNDAITEAIALAHKGPAGTAEVNLHFQQDLWPVSADPSQTGQLLVSLLTNAFEAMQAGGGRLTVLTENIQGKVAWECNLKHHQGGDYVHLRLTDTGHGIPAEIQPRIFDPFFTTRFMGRGLGLASALGIVQNHGGCISFDSVPGHGTSFDVYLPRYAATPKGLEPRQQPQEHTARKILVVEDEETFLALLQALLTELGYAPISAKSGAQALELFMPERKNIALAILDIQMEGMDGKQLARELKVIEPGIKVLISSGYDEQTALAGLEHQYCDGFIHKPYWLDNLREKLQTLLGS